MDVVSGSQVPADALVALFTATFTDSEGAAEGAVIGALVRSLLDTTADDLFVMAAQDDDTLIGAILVSRMTFAGSGHTVFLLSPVAVRSDRQGQGVGQRLLRQGLDMLRAAGVDIVVTYGSPAYYGKVGFAPVTAAQVPPPQRLSQPEGWLAQSLTGAPLAVLPGPSRTVAAFDRPDVW